MNSEIKPAVQPYLITNALKIKTLRLKLDMSQDRFGKKVGLSGKTISAYETGKCIPPLKILDKIANIYDTSFISINDNKKSDLAEKFNYVKSVIKELEEKIFS